MQHIDDARRRLRDFLLSAPVQQRQGAHAGAVAGSLDNTGAALYVYGESTGYYLHWLAALPEGVAVTAPHAAAACAWLERYLRSDTLPLTRIHLQPAAGDWRNDALFAFDLGMIAGGVARTLHHGTATCSAELLQGLTHWLAAFAGEQRLEVCVRRRGATELPRRWSTVGGPCTCKTASRILLLAREVPLPEPLLAACYATLRTWQAFAHTADAEMLHPTLYALEGSLLRPDPDYAELAHCLDRLFALQATDGSLPEAAASPAVRRSDIIAQALRVALFLERALEQSGRYAEPSRRCAAALCARLTARGSLPFTPDSAGESNIWCSLFGEQALRLYLAAQSDAPLPFGPEDLV